MSDDIKCPPPDLDCLWRVAGTSRRTKIVRRLLGMVRAPTRDAALRIAQERYGSMYADIWVSSEPLVNL